MLLKAKYKIGDRVLIDPDFVYKLSSGRYKSRSKISEHQALNKWYFNYIGKPLTIIYVTESLVHNKAPEYIMAEAPAEKYEHYEFNPEERCFELITEYYTEPIPENMIIGKESTPIPDIIDHRGLDWAEDGFDADSEFWPPDKPKYRDWREVYAENKERKGR